MGIFHGGGSISGGGVPLANFIDSPLGATGVYSTTQTELRGSSSFLAAVHLREWGNDPEGRVIGCGDPTTGAGTGTGWHIREFFGQFQFAVADGGGNNVQWAPGTSEFLGVPDYRRNRDLIVLLRVIQSGGVLTMEVWCNGTRLSSVAGVAAGMTPATSNFGVFDGGGTAEFGLGGLAFLTGTATDAQLRSFFEASYQAGTITNSGVTWGHFYTTVAGVPAGTWSDTVGTTNLTLSGTGLVSAIRAPRWA